MFTADLSWSDPTTETVGERRERKARQRATRAASIDTPVSSRSSVSGDNELWWTSGLRKAKSIRPNILRPSTSRSTGSQQAVSFKPRLSNFSHARAVRDPALQPGWIYSTTLSPNLPSGIPLDPPLSEVPELEGDASSQYTNSTELRHSADGRWEVTTPETVDVTSTSQVEHRISPSSVVKTRSRGSSASTQRDEVIDTSTRSSQKTWKIRSQTLDFGGNLDLESLKLCDSAQEVRTPDEQRHASFAKTSSSQRLNPKPLSEWDCLTPRRVPEELQIPINSIFNKAGIRHDSTLELSCFPRFIRRMEIASPKIVLDRLKEDWRPLPGCVVDEEVALEKQLWLLTGYQMRTLGKDWIMPTPACDTGRRLELYGSLSEVYQLSAMHPTQMVHFLTTKPQRSLPLPANVSYLTVRDCETIPLPYPEQYFSHIRASTLPSIMPSAKLPELFNECNKLLAPAGIFEIRIMDAVPLRNTAGPLMRMWIEDRLSVELERLFRCSKPSSLVPTWLEAAGFEIATLEHNSNVTLPCAFDSASSDVEEELAMMIGRTFWKDLWGPFVVDSTNETRWWWEDEAIIQECLQRDTRLECRSIFARKR
ncbi:hypothetical protein ACN47E_005449 [Coniothyrium glycines]